MSCAVPFTSGFWSGGICILPTNECSKAGELLATGQLSNSFPNHYDMLNVCDNDYHTHPTYLDTSKLCHCTPLFTKQKAFCSTSLIGILEPVWGQVPRHPPRAYPTYYSTNCALFCNALGLWLKVNLIDYRYLSITWDCTLWVRVSSMWISKSLGVTIVTHSLCDGDVLPSQLHDKQHGLQQCYQAVTHQACACNILLLLPIFIVLLYYYLWFFLNREKHVPLSGVYKHRPTLFCYQIKTA